MKNKAERENATDRSEDSPGENETREMIAGRTCIVQVRLPDLDQHVPALKQFGVELSDECMRVTFPPLPRSNKTAAYAPLVVWWPRMFSSTQASARWNPKVDILTVSLPTEEPAESAAAL